MFPIHFPMYSLNKPLTDLDHPSGGRWDLLRLLRATPSWCLKCGRSRMFKLCVAREK